MHVARHHPTLVAISRIFLVRGRDNYSHVDHDSVEFLMQFLFLISAAHCWNQIWKNYYAYDHCLLWFHVYYLNQSCLVGLVSYVHYKLPHIVKCTWDDRYDRIVRIWNPHRGTLWKIMCTDKCFQDPCTDKPTKRCTWRGITQLVAPDPGFKYFSVRGRDR